MLTVTIPSNEMFDEVNNKFISTPEVTIRLEHSLVSISKWEAKWKVPFLEIPNLQGEQLIDYIQCMTITQNIDRKVYYSITKEVLDKIKNYIEDDMTATTIHNNNQNGSRRGRKELVTSELIYYWMIVKGIPMECQRWHLNRLLTLISVYNIKESSSNTMSKRDTMSYNRRLNEMRKAQNRTRG